MATFNIRPNNSAPQESGAAFKIMVRICGLIAIGGFFLPYFKPGSMDFMQGISGLDWVKNLGESISTHGFGDAIGKLFDAPSGTGNLLSGMLILGYFIFPLLGLGMLFRGKYSGGPFTILLLFNIAIAVLFGVFGAESSMGSNFFTVADLGYWVAVGGCFLPFVGMFFLDKSI